MYTGIMGVDIQDASKGSQRPAVHVTANVEKKPATTSTTTIKQPPIAFPLTGISNTATQGPKSSRSRNQANKPTTTDGMKGKPILIQELGDSSFPPRATSENPVSNVIPPKLKSPSFTPSSSPSLLPSPTPPLTKTITLSHLEKLLRQASSNTLHQGHLYHTLFSLDASTLRRIFGQVGLDPSFLTAFLEAILSIRERDSKWVDQSIALLDGLRQCGRFGIAVVFISAEKWKSVFEEVERFCSEDQKERLVTVKRFWSV